MRAPLGEALHYLDMSGKMNPWPWVVRVGYLWGSYDVAHEGGSHNDLCPLDTSSKGFAMPFGVGWRRTHELSPPLLDGGLPLSQSTPGHLAPPTPSTCVHQDLLYRCLAQLQSSDHCSSNRIDVKPYSSKNALGHR